MKLKYILGRADVKKSSGIYKEIKAEIEKDKFKRLFLIVPEQATLSTEEEFLEDTKLKGIANLQVVSFSWIKKRLLEESGIRQKGLDDMGRKLLLGRVVKKASNDLKYYGRVSKRIGFLDEIDNMISEIMENQIEASQFDLMIEKISDKSLKDKLNDISIIYDVFLTELKRGYLDNKGMLEEIKNNISDIDLFKGSNIWIDGFSGFNTEELELIKIIGKEVENMSISLLSPGKEAKDKEVFSIVEKTFEKLRQIAKEEGFQESYKLEEIKEEKSLELVHLEKNIYSYPTLAYQKEIENIRIYEALNPYKEAEYISLEILRIIRANEDIRFKDIGIVTPDLESYGSILYRELELHKIPFFRDEKRKLIENQAINFILASIDLVSRKLSYEDVFRFLKTYIIGISKDEVEILENYAIEWGIKGKKWEREFLKGQNSLEVEEIRKKFIEIYSNIKTYFPQKNQISKYVENTRLFFEYVNLKALIESWIEDLREKENLDQANEMVQVWEIIMELLDQIEEILKEDQITLKEYRDILAIGFEEYKLGVIPYSKDQVLVGNLDRTKTHRLKVLFIAGAVDGRLPTIGEANGILTEEEKSMLLEESGFQLRMESTYRTARENLNIYEVMTKATECLYMTYPMGDKDGKGQRPSILIERLKRIFPKLKGKSDLDKNIKERENDYFFHRLGNPNGSIKYLRESLREALDKGEISPFWKTVLKWYMENGEYEEALRITEEALFYKNQEDNISREKTKKLYEIPLRSSISRLEKYWQCPFAHFVQYGIRPKERREFSLRMSDLGNVYHNVMEYYAKSIRKDSWKDISMQNCHEKIDEIMENIISRGIDGPFMESKRNQYMYKKLTRVSKRAAWTMTKQIQKGEFLPSYYEIYFGDKEGKLGEEIIPPIVLKLSSGEEIRLEGQIDRVDILEDEDGSFVKVIDYKSGNKKFNLQEVYYGLQIQLVVYLEAVMGSKDVMGISNAKEGGIFYFKIDDPLVEGILDEKSLEEEIYKKMKLEGIIVKDIKIIKAMDNELVESTTSDTIPAALKKDGTISDRSKVFSKEEFELIREHVKEKIVEAGDNILEGDIKIEPVKEKESTPCDYCEFKSVCQFDTAFEDNNYKLIKALDEKEILKLMAQKEGEKEDE